MPQSKISKSYCRSGSDAFFMNSFRIVWYAAYDIILKPYRP